MTISDLCHWEHHLRDEHRLKRCTDYCYMIKYGVMHVLADPIWHDDIRDHMELLPDSVTVLLYEAKEV